LAPHLSDDAQFVKRFHQEAVSAANLKHTHIVTIHDVGTEDGYHYIAMEFVEGVSLEQRIHSGQTFAPEQVVDIISQVGSALDYAHQRGFIHRDIKPANILIDASGRAVLTDFGIVKALGGSGVTSPLTQAGTVFGTPQYMSPEQVKDEPLDHRSDLYSLGIVCYEMLSGQVPFDGTTTHSILYAQVNNPPPPLREFSGLDVPPPVEAVVEKMLAKERGARYDSAGEFARDLAQAVAGVWPAGMGGETAVVGGMGAGTPPGMPAAARAATVRQPMGPPTPPATEWQPMGPPTPTPVPAPARRSRWPLILGAVAVGAGVLLILAVVGVLVLGIENPLTGIQVARDLKSAQTALDDGDYVEAVAKFSQVLDNDPDNAEAIDGQLEAAADLAQAEQFDAAIAAYGSVWQAKPGEVQALRGLGETYEAKGEWREAAGWYEKWTQAAPEDGNAFLALGSARFNLGEVERTVAAYERAGTLGASSAEMDAHLGLAYFELAQHEEAAVHLQDAVRQTPEDLRLQRALGLAYFELGRYEEASGHLQNAVDQDAEDIQLRRALGLAYFELGRYEDTVAHLQDAVGQYPEDFQLQRALGLALNNLGQSDQAAEHLNKAVAVGADRPGKDLTDVYYVLGGYYFGEQDYEQAISFYEQAQEVDPEGKAVWADEARANLDQAYSRLAQRVMQDALLDLDFSNIVTEGGETYAIAKTGQKVRVEGPVRLVEGPWEGSQALVMEEGTTNEFIDPTLDGTGNWNAGGTTPPILTEQSTEVPPYAGQYVAKVEFPAGCDTGYEGSRVTTRPLRMFDGQTKTFSVWIRANDVSEIGKLRAYVTGSSGHGNGDSNDLDNWVERVGQWYRWHLTFANKSGGPWDEYITIYVVQSLKDDLTLYLDGVQYEEKAYPTTLCHGDAGDGYQWNGDGTPYVSTSERQAARCEMDAAGDFDYSSDHTVLVWMELSHESGEGPSDPAVFHYGRYDTNNSISLMFHRDSGTLRLYAKDNAGVWHERNSMNNPTQPADGYEASAWYMLGYRYDQSENRANLIWDGQVGEQGTDTAWPSADNTYHRLGIGCRPNGGDNLSGGAVGMVAVFSRALTTVEVAALYRVDVYAGR
jgi:tetratricopeptide (TPR) repeat protein